MNKALFATGDQVEYIGERVRWDGNKEPMLKKGMTFLIIETTEPYLGQGLVGHDEEGDELIDQDKDGYNVIRLMNGDHILRTNHLAQVRTRMAQEVTTLNGTFKVGELCFAYYWKNIHESKEVDLFYCKLDSIRPRHNHCSGTLYFGDDCNQ